MIDGFDLEKIPAILAKAKTSGSLEARELKMLKYYCLEFPELVPQELNIQTINETPDPVLPPPEEGEIEENAGVPFEKRKKTRKKKTKG